MLRWKFVRYSAYSRFCVRSIKEILDFVNTCWAAWAHATAGISAIL